MHGAADLLGEEHITCKFRNVVVTAKADLSQKTRSGISVEHGGEKILAAPGATLYHFTRRKGQSYIFNRLAIINGGVAKEHRAVYRILNRAAKNLAIGEVHGACTIDPRTPTDVIGNIRSRGDNVDLIVLIKKVGNALLFLMNFAPGRDRVIKVK